jgi:hypothetical protein
MEACHVEAASEHHPSAALLAGGLEDVVGADDVGFRMRSKLSSWGIPAR